MSKERFAGKKYILTEKAWIKKLTPQQYKVMREKGTDPSFKNEYFDKKDAGIYVCAGCGLPLFSSETKYDSGTGWPSFWEPLFPENVVYKNDPGFFSSRIEVVCSRCESHLGHIFDDGPLPTRKRFCMNSSSLCFREEESSEQSEEKSSS
jgi:peptide-methionine (R)-S-oxide reductase